MATGYGAKVTIHGINAPGFSLEPRLANPKAPTAEERTRVKVLYLPENALAEILQWMQAPAGSYVRLNTYDIPLPADLWVDRVFFETSRRAIGVLVCHPSFPVVAPHAETPIIGSVGRIELVKARDVEVLEPSLPLAAMQDIGPGEFVYFDDGYKLGRMFDEGKPGPVMQPRGTTDIEQVKEAIELVKARDEVLNDLVKQLHPGYASMLMTEATEVSGSLDDPSADPETDPSADPSAESAGDWFRRTMGTP